MFKDLVLNANWTYRKTGVLDQTHPRFFTHRSLHGQFNSSGYQIDRIEGINPVDVSWRFELVNALVGQRLNDTRFKQFACVVRPA